MTQILVLVGYPGRFTAYPDLSLVEALTLHIETHGPGPWQTIELPMDRPFWVYDAAPIPTS